MLCSHIELNPIPYLSIVKEPRSPCNCLNSNRCDTGDFFYLLNFNEMLRGSWLVVLP